jgi:hypothetical protein
MRVLTYTITLEIPENCDLEAAAVTFEQYIADFNEASKNEYPLGYPEATVKAIDNAL